MPGRQRFQDQAVQLSYEGGPTTTQWVGLRVIDRPDKPFGPLLDEMMKAGKLAEGPQRDSAMRAIRQLAGATTRVGRDPRQR